MLGLHAQFEDENQVLDLFATLDVVLLHVVEVVNHWIQGAVLLAKALEVAVETLPLLHFNCVVCANSNLNFIYND